MTMTFENSLTVWVGYFSLSRYLYFSRYFLSRSLIASFAEVFRIFARCDGFLMCWVIFILRARNRCSVLCTRCSKCFFYWAEGESTWEKYLPGEIFNHCFVSLSRLWKLHGKLFSDIFSTLNLAYFFGTQNKAMRLAVFVIIKHWPFIAIFSVFRPTPSS